MHRLSDSALVPFSSWCRGHRQVPLPEERRASSQGPRPASHCCTRNIGTRNDGECRGPKGSRSLPHNGSALRPRASVPSLERCASSHSRHSPGLPKPPPHLGTRGAVARAADQWPHVWGCPGSGLPGPVLHSPSHCRGRVERQIGLPRFTSRRRPAGNCRLSGCGPPAGLGRCGATVTVTSQYQ